MKNTIGLPSNRYQLLNRSSRLLIHLLALAGAAAFLVPFLWMISTSLKPMEKIFQYPPQWMPDPILWRNYIEALTVMPFGLYFRNSIYVTVLSVVGQILSSAVVAYGFARLRFPGRNILFIILLATMMLPWQVTMIPLFILYRSLDWINTYYPLIVPNFLGGSPFFIFLLRQFYMRLPLDLDDAGRIDGASTFGIYRHIILPQSRPALGVVAVFSFLNHWNDFFNPLIFLSTTEKYTLALGINLFRGYQVTQWHLLMAASVMVSFPCILLYALAQRYFIQGIVFTGVKQ
jgi:ABC-type glycerol-3-phosphate transport system permease component